MKSQGMLVAALRWSCALCLAFGLTGCVKNRYYVSNMPNQYVAKRIENSQTLDLSRLAAASTGNDYIDRGDVLEVTISAGLQTNDNLTFPVRVNDQGMAQIQVIGEISLGGLDLEEAESRIAAACKDGNFYRSPHVTVHMKRQRKNRIKVVGAVKKPGSYEIPRGSCDLLAAIVEAEGLAKEAGTIVQVRHPASADSPETIRADRVATTSGLDGGWSEPPGFGTAKPPPREVKIDLVTATKEGGSALKLDDGDIVYVERRDPLPIQVIGLVRQPGAYEYPPGQELRMLGAIAKAQGLTTNFADTVFVIRTPTDSSPPSIIQCSIKKAKSDGAENLQLAPGDVVSVEHNPLTLLLELLGAARVGIGAAVPIPRF